MFSRILIANRGEIACRVIRTCRRMGVSTVAVYSDADAGAMHVGLADVAVRIGGPAPADSYLRGDRIIAAALETGAEAIHPGYGFLSENPDFVDQVTAAGLVFIGPSAGAIRAMGLKDAAKVLMAKAGVPVVPGYHGADQAPSRLEREAAGIGWPVLIKAVAGGGGKGMRRVDAAADFLSALESAKAEARGAFGNDAVLVEKYITAPRHIEVQIFGDGTDAIHLFERDCSLQRRHQKVIEEAPAPGMTEAVRAAMGAAAVAAAKAISYAGAGTVEFIADGSHGLREDGFWFMEMNTRLQVEHPVTELITDVNLVEWQLRVASGEPLPMRQEDLRIGCHAFEARLYAEDVAAGFLPATGRISHLAFSKECRNDTGVRSGDTISPWYDPMIAKIIAWGDTREAALNKLVRSLDETEVTGTVTNLDFLRRLARHEGFGRGEVDTGLIARDIAALTAPRARDALDAAMEAVAVLQTVGLPEGSLAGFALWDPLRHPVRVGGVEAVVAMLAPDRVEVGLPGGRVEAVRTDGAWQVPGQPRLRVVEAGGALHVLATGRSLSLARHDPLDRAPATATAGNVTRAPMPGLVRAVAVTAGQAVAAGDRLAVIEAMKMEHVLTAPRDGVVADVMVKPGDQVEAGAALVTLEEA